MYEMTLDGATFFAPANERYTFLELILHEALNDAGYIDAQVPYTNPLFDKIKEGQSKVELFKDDKVIFRGKIQDVEKNFSNIKTLYIVGELSYLNETIQLQQVVSDMTKGQFLSKLLEFHNSQSEEKFYLGVIGVSNTNVNAVIDYGYTLDIIRDVICGDDGYIKITYRNNRREIDIVPIEAYGKTSNQYIRFGSNLLDYVEKNTGSSIVTAVLPLGERLENSEVEGLDSYLTISEVNNGSPILVNQQAKELYGYRCKTINVETNDVNKLKSVGKAYLTTYQYAGLSLKIKVVDLSVVDSSQDDYDLGDYLRAICEPLEMDANFPVRSKDTNILDISQSELELGLTRTKSLTQATTSSLTSILEEMPQENSLIELSKKNAIKLITDQTTGVVTVRPDYITIADNKNIEDATKVWIWSVGGLGYGTKEPGQPLTQLNPKVAMTMAGEIVGDVITTGTIRGSDDSYWALDGDNPGMHIVGEFEHKYLRADKTRIKSISIGNNALTLYNTHKAQDGEKVATIASIELRDKGQYVKDAISIIAENGNDIHFAYRDPNNENHGITLFGLNINDMTGPNKKTPYVANTASGRLFPYTEYDPNTKQLITDEDTGIEVENGFIKSWKLDHLLTGTKNGVQYSKGLAIREDAASDVGHSTFGQTKTVVTGISVEDKTMTVKTAQVSYSKGVVTKWVDNADTTLTISGTSTGGTQGTTVAVGYAAVTAREKNIFYLEQNIKIQDDYDTFVALINEPPARGLEGLGYTSNVEYGGKKYLTVQWFYIFNR